MEYHGDHMALTCLTETWTNKQTIDATPHHDRVDILAAFVLLPCLLLVEQPTATNQIQHQLTFRWLKDTPDGCID